MSKFFVFLALGVGSLLLLSLGDSSDPIVIAISSGVLGGVLIAMVEALPPMRWIKLIAATLPRCRNREIRVSISYLYRIKIDDKYLLIASNRWPGVFAPVGGVYKRLDGSKARLSKLNILDDDCHPIDERSRDDLRIRVRGFKLLPLLLWFDRGEDREILPWREFYEEMVEPGHVLATDFPYFFVRDAGRRWTYPEWSDERKRYEIFVGDVFDLELSETQRRALLRLGEPNFRWVAEEEIRTRGVVANKSPQPTISARTKWFI